MPLEPQLSHYENEATFTSNFLVPLLRRLGFSVVVEYHGTREFGKDLVFGEIDRLGHVTYHGLQAKYVSSISQSDSHLLVDDCREAFNNPFLHPHTGSQERICCFFVANAGSIADNARTNFFNALAVPHGGNVRLLDGRALVALDRWAMVNRVDFVRDVLCGLRLELSYNSGLLLSHRQRLSEFIADQSVALLVERFRTAAVTNYLTRPSVASNIDTNAVQQYWVEVSSRLNRGLDYLLETLIPSERKREWAQTMISRIDEASRLGDGLLVAIDLVLTQLGPLSGV